MQTADLAALCFFILSWLGFAWASDGNRNWQRESLTRLMNRHRGLWIRNSIRRDLRMIDTSIIAGLQNGTAFFASTSIIAIGGCFALLGATEEALRIYRDLPLVVAGGRTGFELKVCGLIAIFGYAFFKFGWSYRLFNYSSILFGTIPMPAELAERPAEAERLVERAIMMNVLGGRHFNAGLRAVFLSIGYLGWFVGPVVFAMTTALVLAVLLRRQFFSAARQILVDTSPQSARSHSGEKS
ncbi:DUF599 domain-containing protein [Pararhizobium haloflavum]|uniref:DUF599 domain-containing protein n=1 Tax=Pararhizobium haloflavum TaxID=2037914 RepID=UPI000C174B4B|nr:DUF599 family protein [Pararhizobium haloflavum]